MKAKEREQMAKERVTDSRTVEHKQLPATQRKTGCQNTEHQQLQSYQNNMKETTCYICNKPGHLARDCWTAKGRGSHGKQNQVRNIADHAESGTPGHNTSPNNTTETLQHNGATTTIAYKVRRVQQLPFVFAMRSDAICVDKPHVRAVYFDISDRDCDVPPQFAPKNLPA